MFSLHDIFDGKPDHPMHDVKAAVALLAELPKDNVFKALEEVAAWLASVKDTQGFRPERRTEIIMLLDETGRPLYAELLRQYLDVPHLQDFQGLHLWQGVHSYMKVLAEAYAVCVREYQQAEKKPWDLRDIMPVICVRSLRAIAEQMKLELMRYVEIEPSVWGQLYSCYSFAADNQFDVMVYAYPKQVIHTSPQRELLCALMLYLSSPDTLAPDQIEVGYRIAGRLVSFFDFKPAPDTDCGYVIDLAHPAAPRIANSDLQVTPGMRFFGALKAIPKIQGIIEQNERSLIQQEQRFGNEFTPAGKLTVLKHLQTYWGRDQPHRHLERRGISTTIEVIHSFRTVSKLVPHMDLGNVVNLSEEDAAALNEKSRINLVTDSDIDYSTEEWTVLDVSVAGVGCMIPKTFGAWVKIGDLCGIQAQRNSAWWIGMIRRLKNEPGGVHAGIEILTKKPLSVWLRILGKDADKISNWESSSGSFAYDYLPVILLPDAGNSYEHASMLMESGSYVPDTVYQVMMGEKSRDIKLTGLLAEGEDYEQVSFQWLNAAHV